jgi:hypothetical protein
MVGPVEFMVMEEDECSNTATVHSTCESILQLCRKVPKLVQDYI